MIDWNTILIPGQTGLVVEGESDRLILESFLNAGESTALWSGWRGKLVIVTSEKPPGKKGVLNELKATASRTDVIGLIDRDDRSPDELRQFQQDYPHLHILPRWTIENYFIDPAEISHAVGILLQDATLRQQFTSLIEQRIDDGLRHGALWLVLYERGAHHFCHGDDAGYPGAVLHNIGMNQTAVQQQLENWYNDLEPSGIMQAFQQRWSALRQDTPNRYKIHIHGKKFFGQVVSRALNQTTKLRQRQKTDDDWLNALSVNVATCPQDLIPLFQQILK